MRQISIAILLVAFLVVSVRAQGDSSALSTLKAEAEALTPLVTSALTKEFLGAVDELPRVSLPRVVYVQKSPRVYLAPAEYESLSDTAKARFERRELNNRFYYYTRYGTPLAFVRPLDLVTQAGFASLSGARIIDFGFGSIGQLRLMAGQGATAYGIEVDPLLRILYGDSGDTGPIPRAANAGEGPDGQLNILIGNFPGDSDISAALGSGFDIFFSKNTLKRGYIHPEREVDPKMLVHLGVDDSTFVKRIYDLLKPGGYFMIYNLHPALSKPDEPYIPWSDGRCPFEKGLVERIGFTTLSFDTDDTEFAHTMAKAIGWDKEMDLSKDLFGTWTLFQK
jgi:hypothetical protein